MKDQAPAEVQIPDAPGSGNGEGAHRRIPEATVARLPLYLRCLVEVAEAKTVTISSERLADMAGVNAAKVRKDFSYLGSYGTRGVGYDVEYLLLQISRVLGLTQDWPVVIIGVGNLGQALANYRGFGARGFRIAALVDADRSKVGEAVGDMTVGHLDDLPAIAAEHHIAIGIIATPANAAQGVADRLVKAGVTSILNFAPTVITVPRGVSIRKVDLSIELQILSFYQQRRAAPPGAIGVGSGMMGSDGLGPSGPTERGAQGPSGPTERGAQGPSGPTERGAQGPSGPTERGAQGPSGPTERGAQGPSGPTERGAQGPSGPTERGAQGPSGPSERETLGTSSGVAAVPL